MKRLFSFLMVALFSASMWATTYTVAGGDDASVLGKAWDPSYTNNDMTKIGETNYYKLEKEFTALAAKVSFGFKVCENHGWSTAYPSGNYDINVPAGATSALFTFNADTKEVECMSYCTVTGDNAALLGTTWNPSDPNNEMVYDNTSNTYKITKSDVELEVGNIELQIERNHDWAGKWGKILNIPADGTYDVEISFNPYTHEVTAVATPQTPIIIEKQSIYYVNALDWATPKAHQWAGTAEATSWPGAAMDITAETWNGHDVYKYEADPGDYAKCVFTNGASEGTLQTVDLLWTPNKYFIIEGSSDGKYTGTWYDDLASIPAPAKFYVTGDSALVVDAGFDKSIAWSPSAIKVTEDSYVLSGLNAGQEYRLKVTVDGSWGKERNYLHLTSVSPAFQTDGDNNIIFKLATAGDVTVTYTGSVFTVKGDFAMPTLALAGTFSFPKWSQLPMNIAADSLSASIAVDLTVGVDSFKIVKDGSWLSLNGGGETNYRVTRKWPQAPHVNLVNNGRNFVIDVDKAGEYIFKWTYSEDSLFVTFPELIQSKVTIDNPVKGTISVLNGETPVASGSNVDELTVLTVSATPAEGYEILNLRAYETESKKPVDIDSEGKLIMPAVAITITAESDLAAKFYITGDSALVYDVAELDKSKAWAPNAIKVTENSKVLSLKAGTYNMKVTLNGTWDGENNVKGYDELTTKTVGLRRGTGEDNNNIIMILEKAGNVTVSYTGSAFTVEGEFKLPEIKLLGNFTDWADTEAFTPNDRESASLVIHFDADGHKTFKLRKDNAVYAVDNGGEYGLNRGWKGTRLIAETYGSLDALAFEADKAGDYIFTYTFANDSIGMEFPELENKAVTITNLKYGSITVKNGEASVASGANIQENTILTVTAASNSDVDYEVSNLRAFKTGDESTVVEINELHQLKMPGYAITITADERVNSYIMAGSLALFGAEWDEKDKANEMTRQSNGTYQLEKKEVALTAGETYDYKLTRNEKYILPAEGNYHLTNVLCSGKYTLTFTYIPSSNSVTLDTVLTEAGEVVPVVSIATEVNEWSVTADQLVISGDKKTASKVIELTEGIHVFQVVKGIWLGKENMTVTRAANTSIDFSKDNEDTEIYIWADVTGEYTFTWTYETSQLDITYPAVPSPASAWLLLGENVGGEGETWQTLVLTKAGDGKSASIGVDLKKKTDYEFKFIIGNDYRGLDGAESTKYTFHRGHKAAVGAAGNSVNNMLLQADWAGEYTFTWIYEDNGISIGFPDEPEIKYYVVGSFTDWETNKEEMSYDEVFGQWKASVNLDAKDTYQFQIIKVQDSETTWFGAKDEKNNMEYGNCTNWELVAEGHNINLTTTNQTSYPFYFEPGENKVSVTIQEYVPTGVDNAEAGVKAVKTLENGMLIIEKNGVRYNAQGQVIK